MAALAGWGFYLLIPQAIIAHFHLMARLHGMGLVGVPDGKYTYFGLWFRYMPAYDFTVNAVFWAAIFAAAFVLWRQVKKPLGSR